MKNTQNKFRCRGRELGALDVRVVLFTAGSFKKHGDIGEAMGTLRNGLGVMLVGSLLQRVMGSMNGL